MEGHNRPSIGNGLKLGGRGRRLRKFFESFLGWGEPYLAPYLVASVSRDRRPPVYSVKFEIASSRIMDLNLYAK